MSNIVQDGAPVLREVAQQVPDDFFGTPKLAKIIEDMKSSLDAEPDGVALAAPQIGIPYRIFIVRYDRTISPDEYAKTKPEPDVGIFINPKIIKTSRRRIKMEEGCLSVRGIYGYTLRHERATVSAQHEDGSHFTRGGGGLLAQIFQHENDHLDGLLFVDHANDLYKFIPEENTDTKTV
ncbi:MAG TPA: peptide deformylase [Candidatus Kaiserbacteria bacterium]|nr:peptide deformylase [Candidatus Kaiserbacteria bacterium]